MWKPLKRAPLTPSAITAGPFERGAARRIASRAGGSQRDAVLEAHLFAILAARHFHGVAGARLRHRGGDAW